jgi:molybdenum cofactor biosynthesis protein B
MGVHEHKADVPRNLRIAILTVSTTRSLEEDKSGQWMARLAQREGHEVVDHRVVTDDAAAIADQVREVVGAFRPHALLVTGGTGIGPADVTIEAVRPLLQKELSAFGPLFAQLSYEEIDSAALLSRATAGTIDNALIFCMPGSLNACKLACKDLIFPELGHLVKHALRG